MTECYFNSVQRDIFTLYPANSNWFSRCVQWKRSTRCLSLNISSNFAIPINGSDTVWAVLDSL